MRFIPTLVGNALLDVGKLTRKSVHPHACGERSNSGPMLFQYRGSSPRLWGTLYPFAQTRRKARFIPTLVGNAVVVSSRCYGFPVHPHACGERFSQRPFLARYSGSSPRLWGTQNKRLNLRIKERFIPTLVGNAGCCNRCICRLTVHPHACGERSYLMITLCCLLGSSPRLWGTQATIEELTPLIRFIPTLVGNAVSRWLQCDGRPVHPHACGERINPCFATFAFTGSSPRLWGTRERVTVWMGDAAVHPHACGERLGFDQALADQNGSSPRLWGTLTRMDDTKNIRRFIPTLVGNAFAGIAHNGFVAVHPHACGERDQRGRHISKSPGSSPRLWGTL